MTTNRTSLDLNPPIVDALPPVEQINDMFEHMLARRGIRDERQKEAMLAWDAEKKWLMLNQDRQAEQLASGRKTALDDSDPDAPPPLINILAEKAGEMWSATRDAGARRFEKHQQQRQANPHRLSAFTGTVSPSTSTNTTTSTATAAQQMAVLQQENQALPDRYSPEFFIRKFMEADLRAVTPSLAGHLEVNLRTRPIE